MSYEIIWTPRALERLEEIDKPIAIRIAKKVEETQGIPHHYFEKLVGYQSWRLRVGDYRVIAHLDDENKKIIVQTVGHRKKIYG